MTGLSSGSAFLIMRSLNYEGLLDMNFKRSVFATYLEAKCMEASGIAIFRNRANLRVRHKTQLIELCNIARLIGEYNVLMGRLSPQERGIFRSDYYQILMNNE